MNRSSDEWGNNNRVQEGQELDFQGLVELLMRRWRLVLCGILVGLGFAVWYQFATVQKPLLQVYSTTIAIPKKSKDLLELIYQQSVVNEIVEDLNLVEWYGIKHNSPEIAQRMASRRLRESMTLEKDVDLHLGGYLSQPVSIKIADEKGERARQILEKLSFKIQSILKRYRQTLNHSTSEFKLAVNSNIDLLKKYLKSPNALESVAQSENLSAHYRVDDYKAAATILKQRIKLSSNTKDSGEITLTVSDQNPSIAESIGKTLLSTLKNYNKDEFISSNQLLVSAATTLMHGPANRFIHSLISSPSILGDLVRSENLKEKYGVGTEAEAISIAKSRIKSEEDESGFKRIIFFDEKSDTALKSLNRLIDILNTNLDGLSVVKGESNQLELQKQAYLVRSTLKTGSNTAMYLLLGSSEKFADLAVRSLNLHEHFQKNHRSPSPTISREIFMKNFSIEDNDRGELVLSFSDYNSEVASKTLKWINRKLVTANEDRLLSYLHNPFEISIMLSPQQVISGSTLTQKESFTLKINQISRIFSTQLFNQSFLEALTQEAHQAKIWKNLTSSDLNRLITISTDESSLVVHIKADSKTQANWLAGKVMTRLRREIQYFEDPMSAAEISLSGPGLRNFFLSALEHPNTFNKIFSSGAKKLKNLHLVDPRLAGINPQEARAYIKIKDSRPNKLVLRSRFENAFLSTTILETLVYGVLSDKSLSHTWSATQSYITDKPKLVGGILFNPSWQKKIAANIRSEQLPKNFQSWLTENLTLQIDSSTVTIGVMASSQTKAKKGLSIVANRILDAMKELKFKLEALGPISTENVKDSLPKKIQATFVSSSNKNQSTHLTVSHGGSFAKGFQKPTLLTGPEFVQSTSFIDLLDPPNIADIVPETLAVRQIGTPLLSSNISADQEVYLIIDPVHSDSVIDPQENNVSPAIAYVSLMILGAFATTLLILGQEFFLLFRRRTKLALATQQGIFTSRKGASSVDPVQTKVSKQQAQPFNS